MFFFFPLCSQGYRPRDCLCTSSNRPHYHLSHPLIFSTSTKISWILYVHFFGYAYVYLIEGYSIHCIFSIHLNKFIIYTCKSWSLLLFDYHSKSSQGLKKIVMFIDRWAVILNYLFLFLLHILTILSQSPLSCCMCPPSFFFFCVCVYIVAPLKERIPGSTLPYMGGGVSLVA